jgi:hypothetical protein
MRVRCGAREPLHDPNHAVDICLVLFQCNRNENCLRSGVSGQLKESLRRWWRVEMLGCYAFGLQPQGDDANAEAVLISMGVHEEHHGGPNAGHRRACCCDLKYYQVENSLAEGGESMFVCNGNEAALSLHSNKVEERCNESDENVNGA